MDSQIHRRRLRRLRWFRLRRRWIRCEINRVYRLVSRSVSPRPRLPLYPPTLREIQFCLIRPSIGLRLLRIGFSLIRFKTPRRQKTRSTILHRPQRIRFDHRPVRLDH